MVKSVTSLTGNGLRDWLIQRITAVIMTLYVFFIAGFIMAHSPLQFEDWHTLFSHTFMRVFTFVTLLCIFYHTWVGLWTVFTDYIKCSTLRLTLQVIVILALMGYTVWGVSIVWGI